MKLIRWRRNLRARWPRWVVLWGLALSIACTAALEDGNPLGPSNTRVTVVPSSIKVNKSDTFTFTAFGGSTPYSWSLSTTSIGSIVANTGVFTAGTIAGTATVTGQDAVGDTGTATVEVLAAFLTITPGAAVADTAGSVTFSVTGGTASYVFTIANDNSSSTFSLPTLSASTTSVIVFFSIPTTLQGDQTFTITVRDTGNGDVGSAKLTLLAP